MKIAYFVHDLADDAVHRRVRMMRPFADVVLLGFHRGDRAPPDLDGVEVFDLGRTMDAKFARRAMTVARAGAGLQRWRPVLRDVTVFVARQLETLVLAALARRRFAPDAPLVFECLDIHRLMLAHHGVGVALRGLEAHLLRSCALLIVSSPAFLASHFAHHGLLPQTLLLENKVLATDVPPDVLRHIADMRAAGPPADPAWRIGWFGVIRCRRSLLILANLAKSAPGLVEVVIRGRPKRDVIPDFDRVVASTPGLSFRGEYDRHTELATIYGDVHFTWAIDFFEAGCNSQWLLPNRLYEGALYGAVPLAQSSVQTGRWLDEHQCGVRLAADSDARLELELRDFFRELDAAGYAAARQALALVPISALLDDESAFDRFGATLAALPRRAPKCLKP
jgi:hypothetical protein